MSGLVLGHGRSGAPITLQLFRPTPTRVLTDVRDYMTWVLAFRSVALGAHVTVLTADPRGWAGLVRAVQQCGGTIEVAGDPTAIPGEGRPYRPSLVIDDLAATDGTRIVLGPWQSVMVIVDAAAPSAVHALRACDLALVAPCEGRTAENLRRGLALNPQMLRQGTQLAENELVVAMPRRLERVSMPPTPIEYQMLFTG